MAHAEMSGIANNCTQLTSYQSSPYDRHPAVADSNTVERRPLCIPQRRSNGTEDDGYALPPNSRPKPQFDGGTEHASVDWPAAKPQLPSISEFSQNIPLRLAPNTIQEYPQSPISASPYSRPHSHSSLPPVTSQYRLLEKAKSFPMSTASSSTHIPYASESPIPNTGREQISTFTAHAGKQMEKRAPQQAIHRAYSAAGRRRDAERIQDHVTRIYHFVRQHVGAAPFSLASSPLLNQEPATAAMFNDIILIAGDVVTSLKSWKESVHMDQWPSEHGASSQVLPTPIEEYEDPNMHAGIKREAPTTFFDRDMNLGNHQNKYKKRSVRMKDPHMLM